MKRRRVIEGRPLFVSSSHKLSLNPDGSVKVNELGLRHCCLCLSFSSVANHDQCHCACHVQDSAAPLTSVSIVPSGVSPPPAPTSVDMNTSAMNTDSTEYPVFTPSASTSPVTGISDATPNECVPVVTASSSPFAGGKSKRQPYKCSHCRQTGHRVSNCPILKGVDLTEMKPKQSKAKRIYRCSNCKKEGHGVLGCPEPCSRCGSKDHRCNKCPLVLAMNEIACTPCS